MSTPERCYCKPDAIVAVRGLNLHQSSVGDPRGAIRQYRDSRETGSYHVREYEDRICFHSDSYNPEKYPVEHFLHDVLNEKTVAGAAIGFGIGHAVSRGDRKVAALFALLGGIIGNAAS